MEDDTAVAMSIDESNSRPPPVPDSGDKYGVARFNDIRSQWTGRLYTADEHMSSYCVGILPADKAPAKPGVVTSVSTAGVSSPTPTLSASYTPSPPPRSLKKRSSKKSLNIDVSGGVVAAAPLPSPPDEINVSLAPLTDASASTSKSEPSVSSSTASASSSVVRGNIVSPKPMLSPQGSRAFPHQPRMMHPNGDTLQSLLGGGSTPQSKSSDKPSLTRSYIDAPIEIPAVHPRWQKRTNMSRASLYDEDDTGMFDPFSDDMRFSPNISVYPTAQERVEREQRERLTLKRQRSREIGFRSSPSSTTGLRPEGPAADKGKDKDNGDGDEKPEEVPKIKLPPRISALTPSKVSRVDPPPKMSRAKTLSSLPGVGGNKSGKNKRKGSNSLMPPLPRSTSMNAHTLLVENLSSSPEPHGSGSRRGSAASRSRRSSHSLSPSESDKGSLGVPKPSRSPTPKHFDFARNLERGLSFKRALSAPQGTPLLTPPSSTPTTLTGVIPEDVMPVMNPDALDSLAASYSPRSGSPRASPSPRHLSPAASPRHSPRHSLRRGSGRLSPHTMPSYSDTPRPSIFQSLIPQRQQDLSDRMIARYVDQSAEFPTPIPLSRMVQVLHDEWELEE